MENLGAICWNFWHFLSGSGNTYYWPKMSCFMFKRLPYMTIHVNWWWEPTHQCKLTHAIKHSEMRQIWMNVMRTTHQCKQFTIQQIWSHVVKDSELALMVVKTHLSVQKGHHEKDHHATNWNLHSELHWIGTNGGEDHNLSSKRSPHSEYSELVSMMERTNNLSAKMSNWLQWWWGCTT